MLFTAEFWTLAISLTGGIQCLILGSSFLLLKKGDLLGHRLFALLMLLVGLRLFKSAWYIETGDTMPLLWVNIGFAAHLASGPLWILYLQTTLGKRSFRWPWLGHFVLPAMILVGAQSLSLEGFWYRGGYYSLLSISLGYWAYALFLLWRYGIREQQLNIGQKRWFYSLTLVMSCFFVAYVANYFLGLLPYSQAPVIYAIALFPLSVSAWRSYEDITHKPSSTKKEKYQNLKAATVEVEVHQQKMFTYMREKQPFLKGGYSLKEFSKDVDIPSHLISWVLNQHLQTNFSSLLNQHRVDYAAQLLHDSSYDHYSISGIALEAGFNSVSVFNQHFKRRMGATPSAFRRRGAS
ncbi:MAG: helix-turn-helix domain-containing protein [Saprospiraceae bacterium]|nr:helix-turn-helix domain-containing protein [Saprospiraceae bacterium]